MPPIRRFRISGTRCSVTPPCERRGTSRADRSCRATLVPITVDRSDTCLTFPGDVRLLAPNGRIHLTSGEGIHLDAPEVGVTTGRFELAAREAFQRLTNLYQWVGDLLQVRAGRSRTVVEGTAHAEAERTLIRSVKETTIDVRNWPLSTADGNCR